MRPMVFRLAPMSGLILGMTCALLLVPIGFLAVPLVDPRLTPLAPVGAAIAFGYAFTWLYMRPTAFEITPEGLDVVWPLRRRHIPRADILGAVTVRPPDLRAEFGTLLRVGVGGLWGGFGLAWSSRGTHLGLYVSRHADGFVLVRCGRSRSLLITPERPEAFAAAVSPA
jgi:hypothetical protein